MNPCPFELAEGISFCDVSERLVFLDLRGDRYFCLTGEPEESFRRLVTGASLGANDESRLLALVDDGVLAPAVGAARRPVECAPPSAPTRSLMDNDCGPTAMRLAHASWRLALSSAAFGLQPLSFSLARLSSRKSQMAHQTGSFQAATEVAAAFRRTELLLASRDRCLPRSLAIAHALIDRGVTADLIIGVQLRPFAAHCWVQHGNALINDTLDHVRTLTPLLVV